MTPLRCAGCWDWPAKERLCDPEGGWQSRRRDVVELTEAGRQTILDWQRRCRVMEEAMLSGFNPEERRQFADYLSRAYRNLRAEREEGTE